MPSLNPGLPSVISKHREAIEHALRDWDRRNTDWTPLDATERDTDATRRNRARTGTSNDRTPFDATDARDAIDVSLDLADAGTAADA